MLGIFPDQIGVEQIDEGLETGHPIVGVDTEFVADRAEQLIGFQTGIENISRCDGIVQTFQEFTAQGGFPSADLPGDDGESLPVLQGIAQMGQGNFMASAQEKIRRIGHQFEGLFSKSEKGIIHELLFTTPCFVCTP